MGKIFNFYKKMSVDDTICVFGLFGGALMMFAIAGVFFGFLDEWAFIWLFTSGWVVSAVVVAVIFGKNGCFMHDITTSDN